MITQQTLPPGPPLLAHPTAHIRLAMLGVRLPVLRILRRQRLVSDDQEVLRIFLLGGFREIETPRDEGLAVDDDDLVMGNGMLGINLRGYALVGQEIGRGVFFGALALIEDDLYPDTPSVGLSSALAIGAEVKLYACTRMLDFASLSALTIRSVQFPPGVKQTVMPPELEGWAGIGVGGVEAEGDEAAGRG
jgi:hypothetical protein